MNFTCRINGGVLFLLLVLVACTGDDIPIQEPLPEKEDICIRWNVIPERMQDGRTLIGNNADLKVACTPSSGGKAIGIWSAYEMKDVLTEHVLGMNGDVSLIYNPSTSWYNWEGWTYGEEAVFWVYNTVYYFNAYFPKEGGMVGVANTKTALQGTYNTETTQADLMVSKVKVDTGSDEFQGLPVALPMSHALATLKFIFLMDGENITNVLKSFSLDNTLKTVATLDYNTNSLTIDNWTNGKFSANDRIYEWKNDNGIAFTSEKGAVAYTTGNGIYQSSDGHVFIIPQSCTVAPTFNCTIGEKDFGDVFFENISLGNTLFEPGKNYIYTIKVKGRVISELKYQVQDWGDGGGNVEFN